MLCIGFMPTLSTLRGPPLLLSNDIMLVCLHVLYTLNCWRGFKIRHWADEHVWHKWIFQDHQLRGMPRSL